MTIKLNGRPVTGVPRVLAVLALILIAIAAVVPAALLVLAVVAATAIVLPLIGAAWVLHERSRR